MAKTALFWQKKSQKMADFCGFLGKIGVFLVLAPFPAPQNCGILWGPIGAEYLEHLVILSKDTHETDFCFVGIRQRRIQVIKNAVGIADT